MIYAILVIIAVAVAVIAYRRGYRRGEVYGFMRGLIHGENTIKPDYRRQYPPSTSDGVFVEDDYEA